MDAALPCCPACGRPFRNVLDYPSVKVLAFERLPTPEAVDIMSGRAVQRQMERRSQNPGESIDLRRHGINMTPDIERMCSLPNVVSYFSRLSNLVGREVPSNELLPDWKPEGRFKWAHPVPGSQLSLSLADSELSPTSGRIAEVAVHCAGPNLGSAGGPTLQRLGAVALIHYEGLLQGR